MLGHSDDGEEGKMEFQKKEAFPNWSLGTRVSKLELPSDRQAFGTRQRVFPPNLTC